MIFILSENTRLGFEGLQATMYLESLASNSNTASGLELDLRWDCTGSHSSARWYDPQARRFISEDPIGLNGGINLYAYVGNNPINAIDPLGLEMVFFGRMPPIIRQSIGHNRLAPNQRYNAPRIGRTSGSSLEKICDLTKNQQKNPLRNPVPEPGRLARFIETLADLLSNSGLGGIVAPVSPLKEKDINDKQLDMYIEKLLSDYYDQMYGPI